VGRHRAPRGRDVTVTDHLRQFIRTGPDGRGVGEEPSGALTVRVIAAVAASAPPREPPIRIAAPIPGSLRAIRTIGEQSGLAGPAVESIVRCHYLRIAALIGDATLEARLVDQHANARTLEPGLESRSVDDVPYVGSHMTVTHGAGELGMFLGLRASVREQLLLQGPAGLPDADNAAVERSPSRRKAVSTSAGGLVIELQQ
jgi:hypothetical protein